VTGPGAPIRALLIEDNPGDARLIREMLRDAGVGHTAVELAHADRLALGLQQLTNQITDVVLLDLTLPDSRGFETFTTVHTHAPDIALVVLSGLDDETLAVRAVQEGAQDYLVKGQVDGGAILRSMRYAIERQRLESARRDLERQRDEFFSSVSHDLRTPVAAIKAAIGVVLGNMPADMPLPLQRLLGNVDLAADELTSLIEDLLEMARLQSGRVELWRSSVDLRDVIARAARAIEPLIEARGQHLRFSPPAEPMSAWVDAERLGRVLRNLLGNAQKYGRDNGTIVVQLKRDATELRISVTDDGPGIPTADQERIFERFFSREWQRFVRDWTRSGDCAGAGGAAWRPGWVDSTPGHGSTFHIALPVDKPDVVVDEA
jgi:phosphoserine phosphatase RsbU/P